MADGWREEAGLRWRPCEPFGAEVDADLSAPLPEPAARRFVELFRDHALIIARGQSLDREQHNALLALVGPVIAHREGDTGYLHSEGGDDPNAVEFSFHADGAYSDSPFEALSLHAIDVVADASSTRFVHVEQGLDTLPARLRARLEAHEADMMSPGPEMRSARICEVREHPNPPVRAQLPSIRVNPRTGHRYVAVNEMQTAALVGMAWEDSRETLNAVFEHLYDEAQVYEHRWRNGDLILWDNIALQHARGSLREAGRRVLQRVYVGPKAIPRPYRDASLSPSAEGWPASPATSG